MIADTLSQIYILFILRWNSDLDIKISVKNFLNFAQCQWKSDS